LDPMASHCGRIVGKHGGVVHFALFETDAVTVLEVDGGNQQHGMSSGVGGCETRPAQGFQRTKLPSSCSPARALFSGWNWTAKILARATPLVNRGPYTVCAAPAASSAGAT